MKLTIIVGPQGSGKTTKAMQILNGRPVLWTIAPHYLGEKFFAFWTKDVEAIIFDMTFINSNNLWFLKTKKAIKLFQKGKAGYSFIAPEIFVCTSDLAGFQGLIKELLIDVHVIQLQYKPEVFGSKFIDDLIK